MLFSVPLMVVVPVVESLTAEVMTGKFWKLLPPLSGSSVSFAVTPLENPRSIPRSAFWKIWLKRTLLPDAGPVAVLLKISAPAFGAR